MLSYNHFKLLESVSKQTLKEMEQFGVDKGDIDEDGYVTLYHGGVKLPKVLNKDEIFFMTPDYELAKDYARMRGGKVFTLKVKPDDVNWNQGSYEVEYDKGGHIIDGIRGEYSHHVDGIIVPPKTVKIKNNALYYSYEDEWTGKSNYRYLKTYKNVSIGDKMPKTGWILEEIIQHKNSNVQFKFNDNYFDANSAIRYEFNS